MLISQTPQKRVFLQTEVVKFQGMKGENENPHQVLTRWVGNGLSVVGTCYRAGGAGSA